MPHHLCCNDFSNLVPLPPCSVYHPCVPVSCAGGSIKARCPECANYRRVGSARRSHKQTFVQAGGLCSLFGKP